MPSLAVLWEDMFDVVQRVCGSDVLVGARLGRLNRLVAAKEQPVNFDKEV